MSSRVVSVNISGPALSLLIYENIKSVDEQEGFLLGTITTSVTKSVTDDTREDIKVHDIININGVLPLDIPHMYYKHDGELITEKLDEFVGKQKKNVVAWFKYKKFRKLGYKLTIRERILHQELSDHFNIQPNLFTCLVLMYGMTPNKSTHIFQHAFINFSDNQFKIVSMNIDNLSNPCHQYQINMKPSEAFMKLYQRINKNQSDIQIGNDIQQKLQEELKKSIVDLIESEHTLCKLQQEVEELTIKCREKSKPVEPPQETFEEVKELEIEVPVEFQAMAVDTTDFEIIEIKSNNEAELVDVKIENDCLNTSTSIVDLTLSDDDEKPQRKTRNQTKVKTVKNKKIVRN